ncbi:Cyclin-dependent kinase 10 [Kappamyces sp. JEL0680]|nr:Cyclin-dependent kinase 10 [Kappamyces sp. JEL0680]
MADKNANTLLSSFSHPNTLRKISSSYVGRCISVNEFQKLNRVGEGWAALRLNLRTYGIVYRAKNRQGEIVALKRIRMDQEEDGAVPDLTAGFPISSLREISILTSLRHENIVQVFEVGVADGLENVFMIMEYCEQDMAYLMDHVMSQNPANAYKPAEVKCLMQQLLKGVDYLHSHHIVHRDLKLSNILLNAKGILKVTQRF